MSLGYRQRNKSYSLGDITYHSSLPTGYYLECTTAGTSNSSELVISGPVIGMAVNDGTVVWIVNNFSENKRVYIADLNDALLPGIYAAQRSTVNKPDGYTYGSVLTINTENGTSQIDFPYIGNKTLPVSFLRSLGANGWTDWQQQESIVAKSLNSNGYIKYASGIILQLGAIVLNANETYKTKTLPVLFSTAFAICGSVNYANGGTSSVRAVNINILNDNTVVVQTESAITEGSVGVAYLAIGY